MVIRADIAIDQVFFCEVVDAEDFDLVIPACNIDQIVLLRVFSRSESKKGVPLHDFFIARQGCKGSFIGKLN